MSVLRMTVETDFACRLQLYSTELEPMRAMQVGAPGSERMLGEACVVTMAAPAAMVRAARRDDGNNTRHGWMRSGHEMLGLSMAYVEDHFAVAVFDLGEPMMQDIARLALAEDCTRIVLSHGSERVLVAPSLTADCRQAFEDAQAARPASFSSFMRAMALLTHRFALAETYIDMGLDPTVLKSVTISVCMPAFAEAQGLQVMEAKDLRGRTCH